MFLLIYTNFESSLFQILNGICKLLIYITRVNLQKHFGQIGWLLGYNIFFRDISVVFPYVCIFILRFTRGVSSIEKKIRIKLDTISLRATNRSSVRLAPKIPNDVIHDLDHDLNKSQSSRGIILLLLLITK